MQTAAEAEAARTKLKNEQHRIRTGYHNNYGIPGQKNLPLLSKTRPLPLVRPRIKSYMEMIQGYFYPNAPETLLAICKDELDYLEFRLRKNRDKIQYLNVRNPEDVTKIEETRNTVLNLETQIKQKTKDCDELQTNLGNSSGNIHLRNERKM